MLLGKSQVQQKKVLIRDFFNIRDFRELRMCDESMQTAKTRRANEFTFCDCIELRDLRHAYWMHV